MYLPSAFAQEDRATLYAHAAAYPFATLVTAAAGPAPRNEPAVEASHVPLVVDAARGELRGHLAKENPQLRHLEAGAPVLAIFHGPHGYVSPSVYLDPGVPTWNFVVVHARGRPSVLDDAGLRAVLDETVALFDRSDWATRVSGEYLTTKRVGIVAFRIAVETLEGKWKLSQNRSEADRDRVIEFMERGDASSREAAAMMRAMKKAAR